MLIIPANIIAIYRFSKLQLNRVFFSLLVSLCFNNFAMSFGGLLLGLVKFSKNQPLEFAGCVMMLLSFSGATTVTMLIQALISYERRRAILSTSTVTFSKRIYFSIAIVVLFPIIFWAISFSFFGSAQIIQVKPKFNSTDSFSICYPGNVLFLGMNEMLFATTGFLIPAIIIIANYWYCFLLPNRTL